MNALKSSLLLVLLYISFAVSATHAQIACVRAPEPIMIQGSLNAGDVQQAGRITRDGKPSSCSGDNALLENNTALRRDVHNLVNPYNETVCVRVDVDFTGCAGNQTQSAAYSAFNPANPAAGVIGDMGYSTINKGTYLFSVGPNSAFTIGVNEVDQNTGCPLYKLKVTYLRNCRQAGTDWTNDGKADLTVYRPSAMSTWYVLDSETDQAISRNFGTVGDLAVGGSDYTGDGKSDFSLYRPSTNTMYYALDQDSPGTNFAGVQWGVTSDKPLAGDFDGDGRNDVAIYRPSEGNFYIMRSSDGVAQVTHWGVSTDNPVVGDFDGDTTTDIAIVRPTLNGAFWWILKSNYNYGFHQVIHWGLAGDKTIPGDYDGDTVTDLAVWRPSEGIFYVRRSTDSTMLAFRFGLETDKPQPADYDGDGKHDFAIYRPSTGQWYVHNSGTETVRVTKFGLSGDQPMASAYRIP